MVSELRPHPVPADVEGEAPTQEGLTVRTEKPRNGLAGLKHWRYDLRSGFAVAMISLPFSMGIAITSGAPPICSQWDTPWSWLPSPSQVYCK